MAEYHDDPEMLADMHYRIAQGYMNAPDLRLASLETLLKLQFAVSSLPLFLFANQIHLQKNSF